MNKKAQLNFTEWMIYISFVIVAAIFMVVVVVNFLDEKIDTTNIETFVLTKKLLNSESCLAYNDGLRLHQGIIDLAKVNSTRLVNCYTKKDFGYFIKIKDIDNKLIRIASNLDKRQEAYLDICSTIKNFKCIKKEDLILYYDQGQIKKGKIEIEVIDLVE
mgnify:CR=1 FL=1